MKEQINLIKESGLPISKVAEITGINYKKLYRVVNNGAELRYSEVQKLQILIYNKHSFNNITRVEN